ncbi:MAG: hypothetical protein ACREEM_09070 [Blastocatellia bacterium]
MISSVTNLHRVFIVVLLAVFCAAKLALAQGTAFTYQGKLTDAGAPALRNSSAIGWQRNSSNLSFGIGQSTDGLSFFRTNNSPGTSGNTPTYDLQITNQGNVGIGATAPNAKLDVRGEAANGAGIAVMGNASQSLDKGGWIKAMVYVDWKFPAGQQIRGCYNSQATGADATTQPCGFTVNSGVVGFWDISFPFDVSQRFVSVTVNELSRNQNLFKLPIAIATIGGNSVDVVISYPDTSQFTNALFTVIVY